MTLPKVRLVNMINEDEGHQSFFHSVFPSCEGLSDDKESGEEWNYTIHLPNTFVLKAEPVYEYTLYTNEYVQDDENKTNNAKLIYQNTTSSMVSKKLDKNHIMECYE